MQIHKTVGTSQGSLSGWGNASACPAADLGTLLNFEHLQRARLSTISEDIGGALSSLNSIQSTLQHDEQQVLFFLSLINQAHSYVNTVMTSYRSWMTSVFTLPDQ